MSHFHRAVARRMASAVACFVIAAPALAAPVYTSTSGDIITQGFIDYGSSAVNCWSVNDGPADDSLSAHSGSASGSGADECDVDFGGNAAGTFSAITNQGFSISGSTSTFLNEDPTGFNGTFALGRVEREVEFSLLTETDFTINMNWSACAGCNSDSDDASLLLRISNLDTVQSTTYSAGFQPQTAGSVFDQLTLAAGNYRVEMEIYSIVGVPGDVAGITGDIAVSVVPLPPAILLFGSALAGLGVWRRRN